MCGSLDLDISRLGVLMRAEAAVFVGPAIRAIGIEASESDSVHTITATIMGPGEYFAWIIGRAREWFWIGLGGHIQLEARQTESDQLDPVEAPADLVDPFDLGEAA